MENPSNRLQHVFCKDWEPGRTLEVCGRVENLIDDEEQPGQLETVMKLISVKSGLISAALYSRDILEYNSHYKWV